MNKIIIPATPGWYVASYVSYAEPYFALQSVIAWLIHEDRSVAPIMVGEPILQGGPPLWFKNPAGKFEGNNFVYDDEAEALTAAHKELLEWEEIKAKEHDRARA
jgi:hypothetical protein